jgi:hypothetical protein
VFVHLPTKQNKHAPLGIRDGFSFITPLKIISQAGIIVTPHVSQKIATKKYYDVEILSKPNSTKIQFGVRR